MNGHHDSIGTGISQDIVISVLFPTRDRSFKWNFLRMVTTMIEEHVVIMSKQKRDWYTGNKYSMYYMTM